MTAYLVVDNLNVWREGQAVSGELLYGSNDSSNRKLDGAWRLNFGQLADVLRKAVKAKDFARLVVFTHQLGSANFDPFEVQLRDFNVLDLALEAFTTQLAVDGHLKSGDELVLVSGKAVHRAFVQKLSAIGIKTIVAFWDTAAEELRANATRFVSLNESFRAITLSAGVYSRSEEDLIQERRNKLSSLRERGVAFPNDFRIDSFAEDLQTEFHDKDVYTTEAIECAARRVKMAGRMVLKRVQGKVGFAQLQDMTGRIQLFIHQGTVGDGAFEAFKSWDVGDIVAAQGVLMRTKTGELSVRCLELRLLTKSLRPLPDKWHGLVDIEQRYRQRYVDLIVTLESRKVFITRTKVVSEIRAWLDKKRFLEVETPMMHYIPGGAVARPFVTHHNELDLDLYLRVAPELYLKRLVVGGFDRVYEINRNFRNEGVSTRHNPEFTMLELYEAYSTYDEIMDRTESMIRDVAIKAVGKTQMHWDGSDIDLAPAFRRLRLEDAVCEFNPEISIADCRDRFALVQHCFRLGINYTAAYGWGKLLLEIFEKTVESNLIQPTFITHYPVEVSPLARESDTEPGITDRFELFVGGKELANGFSELNDPEDQAARFQAQVDAKEGGDDEAMHFDADYIRALEVGLPPTGGLGVGIDRLVMLFTGSASIRDVLLFPYMRPEHSA